ncbi:uncharacterized protein [Miscanthus floridulus]|uniref:uncharacterized protein isoform X2 n=1 Tax=Miscanthus floridulus TaxID=154761 RepID=UPI003457B69E
MDSINQNSVYYDPQRDVSVSGATQSVTNSDLVWFSRLTPMCLIQHRFNRTTMLYNIQTITITIHKRQMILLFNEELIKVQGSFPVSLRTYVERNLARCKDDAQRTASRSILKEIITKATADGTLHTKNWDIEPLFTLPEKATSMNMTSNGKDSSPFSSSSRSPSRREPVAKK